jgi:hypothetical protein
LFSIIEEPPKVPSIGCSFKFLLEVGVEESFVNNAKSEVRFKQLIRDP